ncbi:MAG: hypothetical protein IPN54_09385 [Bacteroidetes bacterium]|nr:hypothetical protein [Bacteroidota bacterium]
MDFLQMVMAPMMDMIDGIEKFPEINYGFIDGEIWFIRQKDYDNKWNGISNISGGVWDNGYPPEHTSIFLI